MSIKSKVLAAAATLTLVGAASMPVVLSAGSASAATPSCGNRCVNPFSKKFTDFLTLKPSFVLDVFQRAENIGQPIILFQSSNADPAEDWTVSNQGTLNDFVAAGLASPALALHYGKQFAFELQYSPYGVDSGLCMGVESAPIWNSPVSLQPCGVSAKTVWVLDQKRRDTDVSSSFFFQFNPVINAAGTNFSQPYVLTYPQNGNPIDKPRPQLVTQNLQRFSRGGIYDNQMWAAFYGVLQG